MEKMTGGLGDLHPLVQAAGGPQFANGHYDDAVFNAFRAVEDRTKKLSGNSDIGKRLMSGVFNEQMPVLDITSPNCDDDQKADEREGFKFLFMGATLGLRNPRGHGPDLDTGEGEAREMLALASLLMRALDRAEQRSYLQPATSAEGAGSALQDDERPGTLDLIAVAEEGMPRLQAVIGEMTDCLSEVGAITTAYKPKLDRAARVTNMAGRLLVLKEIGQELDLPTQRFLDLANDYTAQMVELNQGMNALIHLQSFDEMSVEDQAQYLFLAESVRTLRDASARAVESVASGLGESFKDVAELSKHMRRPSTAILGGLKQMREAQPYYDEWVKGFVDAGVWGDDSTATAVPSNPETN
ncbi:hypothetical protein MHPYR_450032 [uncultured Mycobacterium sp.]|uniref:Conserved hypothetical protein CHP02391 domain-containing protein n=1 Tax=uncultured Mycobacterium sp. TaxID=171292 RepID=A0A1Y5PJU2_9MYCO|nr:hypothetical protein MHPYR_450032 [uncultured Mycobacterium sp.]